MESRPKLDRSFTCTGPGTYIVMAKQSREAKYKAGKLYREEKAGALPTDFYATLFTAKVSVRAYHHLKEPKVRQPLFAGVPEIPSLSSADLSRLRALVLDFKPKWISVKRSGTNLLKRRLELHETGTTDALVDVLNSSGFTATVEFPLPWGQKVDLAVLNSEILVALECKPSLRSWDQLYKLVGKIQSIKSSGTYKSVWAVIYGDAREDIYRQLEKSLGVENVVLMGNLLYRSGMDSEYLVTSR